MSTEETQSPPVKETQPTLTGKKRVRSKLGEAGVRITDFFQKKPTDGGGQEGEDPELQF